VQIAASPDRCGVEWQAAVFEWGSHPPVVLLLFVFVRLLLVDSLACSPCWPTPVSERRPLAALGGEIGNRLLR